MKKNIIEIKEEVQIGNVILEEGDKIEVMKEEQFGGFPRNGFVEIGNGFMSFGFMVNTPFDPDWVLPRFNKDEKLFLKLFSELQPKDDSIVQCYAMIPTQVSPEIIDVYKKVGNPNKTIVVKRDYKMNNYMSEEEISIFLNGLAPELSRNGITVFTY